MGGHPFGLSGGADESTKEPDKLHEPLIGDMLKDEHAPPVDNQRSFTSHTAYVADANNDVKVMTADVEGEFASA